MAATRVQLEPPPVRILHPFEGYGAQFNANLFSTLGQPSPLTDVQRAELSTIVTRLKPGHSRIFLDKSVEPDASGDQRGAKELAALKKTVELAQEVGAKVNLTYWKGPYAGEQKLKALQWPNPEVVNWPQPNKRKWPTELTEGQLTGPAGHMRRFARVVELAHRQWGCRCVGHVTIQNEVNEPRVDIAKQGNPRLSMRLYEWLYRLFVRALEELEVRDEVKIVAGDLVKSGHGTQDAWLKYIHDNMDVPREGFPSVVDGYSIHVYWAPGGGGAGFPVKLERRLEDLATTVRAIGIDKPLYVTEYGVMKPGVAPLPGGPGSGQTMEFSPLVAFQHAWFNALAPQYGCAGLAKWVMYRTDEREHWGEWGMIDAPNAPAPRQPFGRSPTYRVTRLFNHLVEPGWKAAGLGRAAGGTVLLSKFAGGGHESVAVLNSAPGASQVRVEGLRPGTRYFGAIWNQDGKGLLHPLRPQTFVDVPASGAATIGVPGRGVVGLSTRPLEL